MTKKKAKMKPSTKIKPKTKQKAEMLLEDTSPNGNLKAVVEQDKRVAHLYLVPTRETGLSVRSCWVRNLQPAPEQLVVADLERGAPPMLPRSSCRHPQGAPPLPADSLRIIWFEEGDAAALLEGSELLAVIPAWSGVGGFHGYARDCLDRAELAWPLGTAESNELFERVARAEELWGAWRHDPGALWEQLQRSQLAVVEQALGSHSSYYVIDGGYWPPKAMVKVPGADRVCLVTIGMSVRPQPAVEMVVTHPELHRRIELGLCLDPAIPEEQLTQLAQYLSAQTGLPWAQYTWLGNGHTVPCEILPDNPAGPPLNAMLLLQQPAGAPVVSLPTYRGDVVNLLWMVPITDGERQLAIEHGSEVLIKKLAAAGVGWRLQPRAEVDLTV